VDGGVGWPQKELLRGQSHRCRVGAFREGFSLNKSWKPLLQNPKEQRKGPLSKEK